ncbi:MAG: SIMPL domain-containing protein [Candidatus Zambryskibacteria bacterium]|nr:SIMPL domain-containing protein [Candidatus Zambryskibacteria bacterium]
MDTLFDSTDKKKVIKYVLVFVVILSVFVGMKTLNALKEYSYIGKNIPAMNVVSVTGKGEVYAKPDIASFTYTVLEEGKAAGEAQDKATKKSNLVIDALKKADIEEKDIKTVSYNINPKYEYTGGVCTQYSCPPSKSVISGYEVSQSIEVKVRNIEKAGDMLALVGGLNVSNVSGLNFVVDDMEGLKAEIRKQAIIDAKEKAKVLSKELGVKFDGIVSFYESSDEIYPMPMMANAAYGMAMDSMKVAPSLPAGENKLTTQVTITYAVK